MDHLHAPWRIAYIRAHPNLKGCVFCEAPAANRDAETYVLARGRTCYSILNLYPYNAGHLMVAPYMHKGRFAELTPEEMLEMLTLTRDMEALLERVLKPHGFNGGYNVGRTAGQGVAGHLHLHIVPRWEGDTNFMPVVGDTKVVSDAMADLYARLKAQEKNPHA